MRSRKEWGRTIHLGIGTVQSPRRKRRLGRKISCARCNSHGSRTERIRLAADGDAGRRKFLKAAIPQGTPTEPRSMTSDTCSRYCGQLCDVICISTRKPSRRKDNGPCTHHNINSLSRVNCLVANLFEVPRPAPSATWPARVRRKAAMRRSAPPRDGPLPPLPGAPVVQRPSSAARPATPTDRPRHGDRL